MKKINKKTENGKKGRMGNKRIKKRKMKKREWEIKREIKWENRKKEKKGENGK